MLWFHEGQFGDLTLRRKIFIFPAQFLLFSSRLFAVCYFTVIFKWWVIGFLLFHTFVIMMATTILSCSRGKRDAGEVILAIFTVGLHWLKDDVFVLSESFKGNSLLTVLYSNVLFVIENFVMILMFYFMINTRTPGFRYQSRCACACSVSLVAQ